MRDGLVFDEASEVCAGDVEMC